MVFHNSCLQGGMRVSEMPLPAETNPSHSQPPCHPPSRPEPVSIKKLINPKSYTCGGTGLSGGMEWVSSLLCYRRAESSRQHLTLMLLVAISTKTKWCKNIRNNRNPGIWVLIWEYSARAIHWIPTRQGLDVFFKIIACLCFGRK